jgi:hypothetical protein
MFRLISSKSEQLTPELVKKFITMTPSPTERDLSEPRVKFLAEKAAAGLLIPFHFATAELEGEIYRVNGQHSCAMLSKLNGNFPTGLKAHVDNYRCETREDLAVLFRQIDGRQSSRSAQDVSGAYQGLERALKNVPKPIAKLAVEGIVWERRIVEGVRNLAKGDAIYALLHDQEFHPFILWVGDGHTLTDKTPELKNTQVLAAMWTIFERNEIEAQEWWKSVGKGGNETEGDPATVLDQWLADHRTGKLKINLSPANVYQGCLYAWNAYRGSKSIREIKFNINKGFLSPEE